MHCFMQCTCLVKPLHKTLHNVTCPVTAKIVGTQVSEEESIFTLCKSSFISLFFFALYSVRPSFATCLAFIFGQLCVHASVCSKASFLVYHTFHGT